MAKVLVFALVSALYPTLVALAILMLARPKPVKLFSGFLIGGFTISLAAGWAILAFVDTGSPGFGSSGSARPLLSLVLGLALIAVAVTLLAGHELPGAERRARRKARQETLAVQGEKKESKVARVVARDSFWLAMLVGALLSVPSVWYLSALAEIGGRNYSTPVDILVVFAFNLVMFALIEISLAVCYFAPERAARDVARFDAWTHSHLREIGIVIAFGGGLYLAVKALLTLV